MDLPGGLHPRPRLRPLPEGTTCDSGECLCDDGGTLCGDTCVDLQQDPAHCGVCDHACVTGQTCEAGECTGTDPADAGTDSGLDAQEDAALPPDDCGCKTTYSCACTAAGRSPRQSVPLLPLWLVGALLFAGRRRTRHP